MRPECPTCGLETTKAGLRCRWCRAEGRTTRMTGWERMRAMLVRDLDQQRERLDAYERLASYRCAHHGSDHRHGTALLDVQRKIVRRARARVRHLDLRLRSA